MFLFPFFLLLLLLTIILPGLTIMKFCVCHIPFTLEEENLYKFDLKVMKFCVRVFNLERRKENNAFFSIISLVCKKCSIYRIYKLGIIKIFIIKIVRDRDATSILLFLSLTIRKCLIKE